MAATTSIWRWVVLRAAFLPGSWALGLGLVALAPLLQGLAPLTSHADPTAGLVLPWLSLAGWAGAALGLAVLSGGSAFLQRVPGHPRCAGELGGLYLAALLMQLPIMVGALLAGAQSIDLLAVLPGILALDLHLAAVALLSLFVPLPGALRVLLFTSVIWFVPALLPQAAAPSRMLASIANPADSRCALATLAPTLALCLAAHLLRTRAGASAVCAHDQ